MRPGKGARRSRAWETPRPMWDAVKDHVIENRKTPTRAEGVLWQELKKLKTKGFHFRRQHSIGRFIVDFYCWKLKLAVEVDGAIHQAQQEDDEKRDALLTARGIHVIRFANEQVLSAPESVVASILRQAERRA